MYSIKEKTMTEIYIRKSHFIGIAIPISSDDEAKAKLVEIRKEYLNANHYTYAYILGDTGITQKASDDGEPTRTAGYPILEVLLKQNLTNVIVIVVRYFGGIKLGAGGLIRAYTKAASEVVSQCQVTEKTTTYSCSVLTDYDHIGNIDRYLREHTRLTDVQYGEKIQFHFDINARRLDEVREQLFQKNNFEDHLEIISEYSEYA
ncbi:MAG: YigZ family protein [Bacilli bacterium]|nr:YigZ family protein [Bacilli bacterium]